MLCRVLFDFIKNKLLSFSSICLINSCKISFLKKGVSIGKGTIIHPYVQVMAGTSIGENNIIHQGSIIGGNPKDLKYDGEKTSLVIGDNNVIREFCTLY